MPGSPAVVAVPVPPFDRNPETGRGPDRRLYRLSAHVPVGDWLEEETRRFTMTDHVVVSACVVPGSGPETYIFPADASGEIVCASEMPGSYRGGLDHEEAIRRAGWALALPAPEEEEA